MLVTKDSGVVMARKDWRGSGSWEKIKTKKTRKTPKLESKREQNFKSINTNLPRHLEICAEI